MLNRYSVAQKSGAVGSALGLAWVYFLCLQPLAAAIFGAHDWLDGLLGVAIPLILSVPGIMLIVVSVQLMRFEPTRDRIKNLFGVLCGFGTFVCAFLLLPVTYRLVSGLETSGFFGVLSLFASLLIMLPLYAGLSQLVMRRSGIVSVKGEFIGRGCYLIFALLLWQMLMALVPSHAERLETDTVFDLLLPLMPFIVPYALYRLAVKYLVRDTIDEQVALDYPSKAEAGAAAEATS